MKLTNREKILVAILGACLLIFLYYSYLVKPQFARIDKLKAQVEQNDLRIQTVKLQTSPNNKVFQDYKKLNAEIANMTKRLFPSIIQEKIITILDDVVKNSGVELVSISFTEPKLENIEQEQTKAEAQSSDIYSIVEQYAKTGKLDANTTRDNADQVGQQKEEDEKYKVEKMTASVNCKGKYIDIVNFIQNVEMLSRKVLVKGVNISRNETDTLNATILLDFYAIPKLHDQDADYINWTIINQYGKENPFDPFSGYAVNTGTAGGESRLIAIRNDFFITLNPISADLPTVMVGRQENGSTESYIAGDNENFENVEMQLVKKDGKYYYRYKTQRESYPSDYKELAEFEPYGDSINIAIVSSPRNSSNDRSGINLTLTNQTDRRANVYISFDDSSSPRVKIVKTTGDIAVKRSTEE